MSVPRAFVVGTCVLVSVGAAVRACVSVGDGVGVAEAEGVEDADGVALAVLVAVGVEDDVGIAVMDSVATGVAVAGDGCAVAMAGGVLLGGGVLVTGDVAAGRTSRVTATLVPDATPAASYSCHFSGRTVPAGNEGRKSGTITCPPGGVSGRL